MQLSFGIMRNARLESLQTYRNFVEEAWERTQISNEIILVLKLALDEVGANIIVHGYNISLGLMGETNYGGDIIFDKCLIFTKNLKTEG